MEKLIIIEENEDFLVINKPACIHSVQNKTSEELSIAELLISKNPEFKTYSKNEGDGGLVNRLDFETSGILIAAKSKAAWEKLRAAFSGKGVIKEYLCLIEGRLDRRELTVSGFIGSPYRNASKVRVYKTARKRFLPASAIFTEEKFYKDKNISLARIVMDTGRRHQVRAFAAFLGNPLVGDSLYGSKTHLKDFFKEFSNAEASFFLHAEKIRFSGAPGAIEITVAAHLPD